MTLELDPEEVKHFKPPKPGAIDRGQFLKGVIGMGVGLGLLGKMGSETPAEEVAPPPPPEPYGEPPAGVVGWTSSYPYTAASFNYNYTMTVMPDGSLPYWREEDIRRHNAWAQRNGLPEVEPSIDRKERA